MDRREFTKEQLPEILYSPSDNALYNSGASFLKFDTFWSCRHFIHDVQMLNLRFDQ